MARVVKSDFPQAILFENQRKVLCDVARFDKLSNLIDIDIFPEIVAVAFSAHFPIHLLLCFQAVKQFLERRDKRQRTVAGFRLGSVFLNDLALTVKCHLGNSMTNRDGFLLKINRIPFQPHDFAAAQAIESTENNGKLYRVAFDNLK